MFARHLRHQMRQNMIGSIRKQSPIHICYSDPSNVISNSALHNGTATIFSSDHCPFRYDHPHGKPSGVLDHPESMEGESDNCRDEALQTLIQRKAGSFRHIPNGIPGVETRLPLLYTGGLASGRISPQKFVELTSTNPAKLVSTTLMFESSRKLTRNQYGLYPRKGALMVCTKSLVSQVTRNNELTGFSAWIRCRSCHCKSTDLSHFFNVLTDSSSGTRTPSSHPSNCQTTDCTTTSIVSIYSNSN
jgi:hypothetical protein